MDLEPPDESIPARLEQRLRRRTRGSTGTRSAAVPRLRVRHITSVGLGGISHYLMADRVLDLEPDLVVLGVNLRWLSRDWIRTVERSVLVGWLPARRWPEALALPLHEVGLTADRAAFHRLLVVSGAVKPWHAPRREQVRVARAWDDLTGGAGHGTVPARGGGLDLRVVEAGRGLQGFRADAGWARRTLGEALGGVPGDHPMLRVLDALLARFREAAVPSLVYVAPVNVAHLEAIGVLDRQGLGVSVSRLRDLAERHGAHFLDLHGLLPDAAFSDPDDHLILGAEPDGADAVAARLVGPAERVLAPRL